MTLFDTFIFVDWSARNCLSASRPRANAIWAGFQDANAEAPREVYFRGRRECAEAVRSLLIERVESGRRVLVGFDFAYGYPRGLASALGLRDDRAAWSSIWSELARRFSDTETNRNNRFRVASDLNALCGPKAPGPWWGVPRTQATATLAPTSPGFPYPAGSHHLERLRLTERRLRGVQETWKLFGPGSVGGQTLAGIPYLHALRTDPALAAVSRVWPFETGFTATPAPSSGPFILHSEVWPGLVEDRVSELHRSRPEAIRDCIQVRELCRWARSADRAGTLRALFDRPRGLSRAERATCASGEGWILGAQ